MMPPIPEAPAVRAPTSYPERGDRVRWGLLAAFCLLVIAAGLRALVPAGSDVPAPEALLQELREVHLPWAEGAGRAVAAWWRTHDAGARLAAAVWVEGNGQLDHRAARLGTIVLQTAALAGLLLLVAPRLPSGVWVALVGAVAALLASPVSPLPAQGGGGGALAQVVLLAVLQLHLAGSGGGRGRWSASFACGALNALASTAGAAAVVAVAVWMAVERRRPGAVPVSWRAVAAHGALALGAALLAAVRVGATGESSGAGEALPAWLWPGGGPAGVVLGWIPVGLMVIRWWRGRARADLADPRGLALVALWAPLLAAAVGIAGGPDAALVGLVGLVVNAACLAAWLRGEGWRSPWGRLAGGFWLILMADAVVRAPAPPTLAPGTREAVLRQVVRQGDAAGLAALPGWTARRAGEARALLGEPRVAAILPPSIRRPLPLEWEQPAGAPTPVAAGLAAPPGSEGVAVFGPEAGRGDTGSGERISRPQRSTFPWLQFRVHGVWRPPEASLTLRDASGRSTGPVGGFSAAANWRRVHFVVPAGEFRVVWRNAGPAAAQAFTAPVEIGGGSWLVAKVPGLWTWLLVGGVLALVGAGWTALRQGWARSVFERMRQEDGGGAAVAPWLALAAYGVFLAGHIDTTAGPNDSGGYLNAAKLLAGGQLTAPPRAPLSEVVGAEDVAPYVPATFRATADGRMAPGYPLGFPLAVAALAQVLTPGAAVAACLWLHLVAGVVVVQRLGRCAGLTTGWAWLGAGVVGLSPVYVFHGLQPLSDVPGLTWAGAALLLAWTSKGRPGRAFLAGAATAVAVLIRPTNLLVALPIVVVLAGRGREWLWWLAGGLPGAIAQGWINRELYGGVFASGYGDLRALFGTEFLLPTLGAYARWLPLLLTPVVALAPLGLGWRAVPARTRLLLATWATAFLAVYGFYWCTWDHWCGMRFVLPGAPALVILGLFGLRRVAAAVASRLGPADGRYRSRMWGIALGGLLLGWVVADGVNKRLFFWLHANREHRVVAEWVAAQAPAGAVVLAGQAAESLWYYTSATVVLCDFRRTESVPEKLRAALRDSGRPIFAVVHPVEAWWASGSGAVPDAWGWEGKWQRVASPWPGGTGVWRWQDPGAAPEGRAR